MSVAIQVTTINNVLPAFEEAVDSQNSKVLIPLINKMSKMYGKARFIPVDYIPTINAKQTKLSGWFIQHYLDIPLHRDVTIKQDVNDTVVRSVTIAIKVNPDCVFSKFIIAVEKLWEFARPTFPPNMTNKQFHYLITRKYSDEAGDKAGFDLPNPLIRMKVSFGRFPSNHPSRALAGTPYTEIFDIKKPIIKENGEIEPGKYESYELNPNNVSTVLSKNTIIRGIMIDISSIAVATYISIPIRVVKLWIENIEPGFVYDEEPIPIYTSPLAFPVKEDITENEEY